MGGDSLRRWLDTFVGFLEHLDGDGAETVTLPLLAVAPNADIALGLHVFFDVGAERPIDMDLDAFAATFDAVLVPFARLEAAGLPIASVSFPLLRPGSFQVFRSVPRDGNLQPPLNLTGGTGSCRAIAQID